MPELKRSRNVLMIPIFPVLTDQIEKKRKN